MSYGDKLYGEKKRQNKGIEEQLEEKGTVKILNLVVREDFIEKETFEQRPERDKGFNSGGESPRQSEQQAQRPELRANLKCLQNNNVSVA